MHLVLSAFTSSPVFLLNFLYAPTIRLYFISREDAYLNTGSSRLVLGLHIFLLLGFLRFAYYSPTRFS